MNRPHDTELVVDPHVAQWAVRTMTRAIALYAMVVGASILIGGRVRFTGLSYIVALHTPGAPWSWGAIILGSGIAVTIGTIWAKARLVAIAAFVGACWALLFASAFGLASLRYEQANTTALSIYLLLAVLFMVVAGVHYAMNPIGFRRNRKA